MQNRLFFLSLYLLLLGSCTVNPVKVTTHKIEVLATLLDEVQSQAPYAERRRLSRDIFYKVQTLTREFELMSPPLWHNFLVNMGLRKKGLCFHWSDALYLHLKGQGYTSFSFHLVGANVGEYFGEHNALVVVSKGGEIQDGIIIDPWRDSGKLYFSKVKNDKVYTWRHRLDRGCAP